LFAGHGLLVRDRGGVDLRLIGKRRNVISRIMIIWGISWISFTVTKFAFNY